MRTKTFKLGCIIVSFLVLICGCQEEKKAPAAAAPKAAVEPTPAETQTKIVTPPAAVKPEKKPAETVTKIEPQTAPRTPEGSDIIVTVNGTVITRAKLDEQVQPIIDYRQAMQQNITPSQREQYESQMLDNMITEILFDQQVKANNIKVTDQDVDNYITDMIKTSDPNMTLEDFKSQMEARGTDFDQLKSTMQKRLMMTKLLEITYPGELDVSEEEAQKFYDENPRFFKKPEMVKASHILITYDKSDPNQIEQAKQQAKQKAQNILEQIRNGADFAEMAKAYSACPSASRGGDLGFNSREQWVQPFSDAAFGLKVGEVSDIVETIHGFHIIKSTGRQDASVVSFDEAKDNIIKVLQARKEQALIPQMIEKMKEDAEIVYPPNSTLRAYQPAKSRIRQGGANLRGQPATQQSDSDN
jgi:peptidyl-prolyl cis-trans isomerase C